MNIFKKSVAGKSRKKNHGNRFQERDTVPLMVAEYDFR